MARVVLESEPLLKVVEQCDDFRTMTLVVRGGTLEVHSTYQYGVVKIPCFCTLETMETRVLAGRLKGILRQLDPQTITLDLHRNATRGPASRLFAIHGCTPTEFDLCNEYALDCR